MIGFTFWFPLLLSLDSHSIRNEGHHLCDVCSSGLALNAHSCHKFFVVSRSNASRQDCALSHFGLFLKKKEKFLENGEKKYENIGSMMIFKKILSSCLVV